NLARIEAGRVDYSTDDEPVEDLIAGVMPLVEPQLERKGIAFSRRVDEGLVARADGEKVQQILVNLLGNAVKFTAAGGQVRLEAERDSTEPEQLLLRIIDTGIGIPTEKCDAV